MDGQEGTPPSRRPSRRRITPPPPPQPTVPYHPHPPEPPDWRSPVGWIGRPSLRSLLLGIILDVPFVVLTALFTHHNWVWMILVGVALPILLWFEEVYMGWFGRLLGMDKPPPPLTWDDPPSSSARRKR